LIWFASELIREEGHMGQRVLVVDDDPATLKLITDVLTDAGLVASSAPDGEACLRTLATERPDLVILDLMMPGLSGLQVLWAIRNGAETRDLPVIMLTARDQYEDKLKGWMGGADRHITKPLNTTNLVVAVQQMLSPPSKH
jgi:DNA-binding response OmpR family regulator